jgi:hypothetical protein
MKNLKPFLFIVFLVLTFPSNAKTIRYVKVDGIGDGTSWANASNSIQTMIDNSASGDEVWVAKGTYHPIAETIPRDPRSRSFLLKEGVRFYGGFAGNETTISQRAFADLNTDGNIAAYEFANKTLLSGDIDDVADVWIKTINTDGTFTWTISGNSGNCYSVVTAKNNNYVDGFFIEGGNANEEIQKYGGGIYIYSTIYSYSTISNCNIFNCSANVGGGIYSISSDINNCNIINCTANLGGGVYADGIDFTNIKNCNIANCSANGGGGGIYTKNSSTFNSIYLANCNITNCCAIGSGGGIFSITLLRNTPIIKMVNSNISNCTAISGGGIYAIAYYTTNIISYFINCIISNCSARSDGGGGYLDSSISIYNCAASNNKSNDNIGYGVFNNKGTSGFISPDPTLTYNKPTSFIGVATTEGQELELKSANWRLKKGSPCINAGTSTNVSSTILTGKDLDNNPRLSYGSIDIGAYEYVLPTIPLPSKEDFNNLSDWNSSNVFYNFAQLNGGQDLKWNITNQKAQFSWQTNLTSTYSNPFFSYQVDATNSTKVYLRYDMYYQAYAGTISPLGTEKLNIEYSSDFVTWSNIAIYTNANGTIANQTYKHDLSSQLAGKKFYIRFNANGDNSNRIEKWEIDNVIIDADGLSAIDNVQEEKYKYSVNNGVLSIGNLEHGIGIQMYDINGRLIKTIKSESNTAHLALPVKGVYLVKVSSDSGVENKKMVW